MSAQREPAKAVIAVPVGLKDVNPQVLSHYGFCVEWLAQFAVQMAGQEDCPYTVEQLVEGFTKNVYTLAAPEKVN